ncbi:hypothetical protein DMN91_006389 [Ooceraea biroi]|uniref:Uncharacterized protein n=1 Tax=Ooceraea biroi TaxID=2015173 RepID=A0A3L8DNI9_OOCBI|nr:hypothetical protein DMN91_006389 [Ooceraea biroi]
MEQQRQARKLIIIVLLTIASVHPSLSSSEDLYAFTTTIDISTTSNDQHADHASSQPSSTTTSIYQDTTTYLPFSTSVQTEETLKTSETNILNRYAEPSYHHEDSTEDDDPEEAPNHVIPYSEHEEAINVPTRPKYIAPGTWAKPPPEKDISLDFVPTKLHAQVRGTHTVKRLPQQEAIENAESDEEKRNAPRLREIVTNSKVNTVYTEEGYEDSAYDHAGHIRDADFHEGFARKLHDRKDDRSDSSSGKRKAEKHTNLVPEEFKEYQEDYQNHLEESRKPVEASEGRDNLIGYGRNFWEGTEIDPKLVAEDGVRRLEKDVEEDAAEAERSSKDYQNAQESKLRNDIKVDSLEESNRDKDELKDKESEPVKMKKKKKKKSKSQNEKVDSVSKGTKPSRRLERKKKLHQKNYVTTAIPSEETSTSAKPEAFPSFHGFVANPASSQVYSIDRTTLRYVAPVATSSFQQIDEPTTISYSQLFWDYFKAQQDPISTTESSTFVTNTTILDSPLEKQSPIAVATIDGHGPYLLVKQETTTSPFLNFHPQDSFSDRVEFDPSSAQVYTRHLLGQNNDESGYVANVIAATSTVATFTSVQPFLSPLSSSSERTERSTTTVLDDSTFSSTPAVMTLNITQEAYSRIAENPFLAPILDNSNIAVTRNKVKYKVLVRPTKKIVKSVTPQSTHQQASSPSQESEKKKLHNELNAKYTKMLDHMKNKPKIQKPFSERKKLVSPEDLTLMRPPIPQQAVYPIFSADRPSVADHSSVTVESESPREEANWRSPLQDRHRFQSVKLPYRFDSSPAIQPVHPTYRKDAFLATKLLPPSPPSFANIYANYQINRQNDHHFSYSKPQQRQQHDNVFRYFPEASWRTHFRRKRSEQGEFCNDSNRNGTVGVKVEANNSVTNEGKPEQRDKNATRASFAESRDSESGTSPTLINNNRAVANGENENAEDKREVVIDRPKLTEEESALIQSAHQDGQMNVTNTEELTKQKNILRNETQSEVNLRNRMKRRSHEELLDESPKISGDVIDKEIAARFNERDDNATSAKIKEDEKVEVDVPSFDYIEEFAEDSLAGPSATTEAAVDSKKYPFYNNKDVPSASALKYVVDPRTIPQKTARGMEFYESRNAYKQCDEVEPNLDEVLPEKEEPDPERKGPQEDLPRLRGLGRKLDCFKAKYFDENPFDNPLFAEKSVEEPTPPSELDPAKFASRIMVLPEEDDDYVVQQVSKKPERHGRQWRNRNRPYEAHESIRVNYKHDPQTGRGRNAYLHTVRGTRPSNARRKTNNRKSRPRVASTTTTRSPKLYQTASYQNQVYEDVMGNIRNMVNTYQVYEITTMPPAVQALSTAGSETSLKIVNVTSSPPKEKSTPLPNVTDATNSPKMIKGLIPPPKYLVLRQAASYRKQRPPSKSSAFLLRSPNLSRIIAHHHAIKSKRSVTEDTARNSSEINKDKTATEASTRITIVGNNTIPESAEKTTEKTNATSEMPDLEIEESRQINMQDRSLSTTLKIDDRGRKNFSSSDQKNEPPQKIVYTIRDRIRYSKPKWDARGFDKFSANPKAVDEDNRRKEPRYNHFKRKNNPTDDQRNDSTILNSIENTWRIESAMPSIRGGRESGTTEVHHPEESVMQMIYDRKDKSDPEPEKTENLENMKSEENSEEETESTTSMYQVREHVDENASTTTIRSTNPPAASKEVLNLREYLESDPPGYAETFPEETTTLSSERAADANHESEEREEKQQDEENNYPKNVAPLWDDDSSEKAEEQVETPTKTESSTRDDDDSEELSSREEEGSNKQTFFTYTKRPTSAESDDKDDEEDSKKETFYHPFPFSRYKSKIKKESNEDESEEESEEKSEDYVFPWQADKGNKRKRLPDSDRYEYPWERRERLAKEQREKRKRANRFKKLIFDDEDEDEEETKSEAKRERPVYPWEVYDVPSTTRANARRGISRRYVNDNEESNSEQPPLKFSSKYSSSDVKPFPGKSSRAREISRSIKKILEEDDEEQDSREVADYPSFGRKSSSSSERGISRGTLVPENVTQPSRKRTGRRRDSRVDGNASSNSRFDSKNLKSRETDEDEEEDESAGEYLRLNKNNLDEDNSESRIETTSQPDQLSTTEISSTTRQRMKRRRRISKNNSTISVDNSPVESITKPAKRRRRKPHGLTRISTDLETSKSVLIPVQRKYSETGKVVKTHNNSDSAERSDADHPAETSTPKTGTVERRSRISKEKIVRKTVYPDENFDSVKVNATRTEPVKILKIKSRRRKNNNKRNDNTDNDKKELMKQKNEEEDYDKFFGEDEIKRFAILENPEVEGKDNPLKSFGVKREEIKRINNFSLPDRVINDDNNDDFWMSEVSLSPHHRTVQLTQYGARQITSSMSWISKNYDY